MKTKSITAIALAFFAAITLPSAPAEEAKEVEAGPRGGRLLATAAPRPEFFVENDHTISVKFYDADMKPVDPVGQEVTVIATGSAKAKLKLEKKDGALVSSAPLPEGDGYNLVIQVRPEAGAKPENFRFVFLNHICAGTCGNPEYACTCDE